MGRQLRCRTCGDPILLVPRPGFIIKGQPKYFAVNPDDRQPHARRCRITMDLRAARAVRPNLRKLKSSLNGRSPGRSSDEPITQKDLFP